MTSLLALTLLLASLPAAAQPQGTLRGIVVTEAGSPIAGATVRAGDNGPAVMTDASGLFNLKVPAKTYDVIVSKKGFATERVPGVAVPAGKTADISALLKPGK
ncbi:MAG: carboxypeptidase regulatory-like domain-containing protein [Acidobacteria bacterium]|nr:carboxypeptidase regulatory-like domain-containing protein [Acidobacteriota bacterium]